MMDYFNRYRARKQAEPQAIELDENGRANTEAMLAQTCLNISRRIF